MHDPTVCNALIAKIPFYATKKVCSTGNYASSWCIAQMPSAGRSFPHGPNLHTSRKSNKTTGAAIPQRRTAKRVCGAWQEGHRKQCERWLNNLPEETQNLLAGIRKIVDSSDECAEMLRTVRPFNVTDIDVTLISRETWGPRHNLYEKNDIQPIEMARHKSWSLKQAAASSSAKATKDAEKNSYSTADSTMSSQEILWPRMILTPVLAVAPLTATTPSISSSP